MKRGITFGTFDVFRHGHLRRLERSRKLRDHLTAGVSSDERNVSNDGRPPNRSSKEREAIVGALRVANATFVGGSMDFEGKCARRTRSGVANMGAAGKGEVAGFEELREVAGLPCPPGIATTALIGKIRP